MSRNVALFLLAGGIILLAFNLVDLADVGPHKSVWIRIASNICIIILGIGSLMNLKSKRKEN